MLEEKSCVAETSVNEECLTSALLALDLAAAFQQHASQRMKVAVDRALKKKEREILETGPFEIARLASDAESVRKAIIHGSICPTQARTCCLTFIEAAARARPEVVTLWVRDDHKRQVSLIGDMTPALRSALS